jgi:hypothetical protein
MMVVQAEIKSEVLAVQPTGPRDDVRH